MDDEPFNLMVLEGFFRMIIPDSDIQLELHQAINGEQGLQIINKQQEKGEPIDAVFTDHQMPVMGGSALAKNIRELEVRSQIEQGMPIILVSGEVLY